MIVFSPDVFPPMSWSWDIFLNYHVFSETLSESLRWFGIPWRDLGPWLLHWLTDARKFDGRIVAQISYWHDFASPEGNLWLHLSSIIKWSVTWQRTKDRPATAITIRLRLFLRTFCCGLSFATLGNYGTTSTLSSTITRQWRGILTNMTFSFSNKDCHPSFVVSCSERAVWKCQCLFSCNLKHPLVHSCYSQFTTRINASLQCLQNASHRNHQHLSATDQKSKSNDRSSALRHRGLFPSGTDSGTPFRRDWSLPGQGSMSFIINPLTISTLGSFPKWKCLFCSMY